MPPPGSPGFGPPVNVEDFNVAAKSLVDLSHLQETVVWLVNQLHRHQDEIATLQQRRDSDIPDMQCQGKKMRHWMIQKSYKYFYHLASLDGFKAFYGEWTRARTERAKWNKASWHAAKMYCRKAHAIWFDVWQEEKRNSHLVRFSLRNMRSNRLARSVEIWQWAWHRAKQDRAIIRSQDCHRAQKAKLYYFNEFCSHVALMKKHKWVIKTCFMKRSDRVKSKIVHAWKFLTDFNFIQEHKLWSHLMRKARLSFKDAMDIWKSEVMYNKATRGIVRRCHSYRTMRKLTRAMEDWVFATTISRKARLLAEAEAMDTTAGDPVEVAKTLEAYVQGIVNKPKVRPYELQAASSFLARIAELKLGVAMTQVSDALDNKVNKPSAEDVARRSRQPKKDTFSSKLKDNDKGNKSGVAGSTKPSGPSVTKYTDTLQAIKDANAKEEAVKKRLEEKKQAAMDKVNESVLEQAPQVVYPPLGPHYFEQAARVEREKAIAAEHAEAEARVAADIQAEMAMGAVPGMPVSSTRKLLEMQYRKEMKMKMAHDMNAPPGMHFEPGMPPLGPLSQGQLDLAVLEAADAAAQFEADERSRAALEAHRHFAEVAAHEQMADMAAMQAAGMIPPGAPLIPGALAEARAQSMRLRNELDKESKAGQPGSPPK